jgi:anti-sigma regulatory factor (Ser/Thr protein kinase)
MPSAERSLTLPPEPASVRTGRHFARDVVEEWNLPRLADDVQLGVSELVTNALRHAGTDFVLTLRLGAELTVEVRDSDPAFEHLETGHTADPLDTSGRGLQIVAAVSRQWGVRTTDVGKAVWFTLDLPDAHSTDADFYTLSDRRDEHDRANRASRAARRNQPTSRQLQEKEAR